MSITTKTGDKGQTSLWSGEKVSKDDLRVEAYGSLDELDAYLGETKLHLKIAENREIIEKIQNLLKNVMSELATTDKEIENPLTNGIVEYFTSLVLKFEETIKIKGLIVPGKTIPAAKLDICRTIARRAERRIISLAKKEKVSENVLAFVNRLSDLLFLLARSEE
jgi:ATP:cob(I)alamin adenosyltransferase